MLPFFLILLTGGSSVSPAATAADERFIRPNPTDGGTVGSRLRPLLPTNE